eukprot:NODE_111_length_19413_cov_0.323703.p13 type:complete len:106 gc:universal NODE_111_length_19413_cov_0.323703:668-985(+)
MWHSKENQFGELFIYIVSFGSGHGPHGNKEQIRCHVRGTLMKTNLETYTCTKCHLEIDRDHMTARNIYIKYLHPYSVPPQVSESVSDHCNGDLVPIVSLWKFSIL